MLSRSISRTEAAPTPIASARARIFAASRARASAERCWESRAPHAPATHDRNLGEHRAVHGENALDADAVGNLPHGERLAHAAAATRNADAFERLNALLLTFFYTDVDAQCVTGAEGRNGAEP